MIDRRVLILALSALTVLSAGCPNCAPPMPDGGVLPPPAVDAGVDAGPELLDGMLSISPASSEAQTGQLLFLRARYTDWLGNVTDRTGDVTWTIESGDPEALKGPGVLLWETAAEFEVKAQLLNLSATAQVRYRALDENVVALLFEPPDPHIPLGQDLEVFIAAVYDDGSVRDVTAAATLSTTGQGCSVELREDNWFAHGDSVGVCTIDASFAGVDIEVSATVFDAVFDSIEIIPSPIAVPVSETVQLTALAVTTEGEVYDLTASVGWAVQNPLMAEFTTLGQQDGLLRGITAGSTLVTANIPGGPGAIAALSVTESGPDSFSVTPPYARLAASTSIPISAHAVFPGGQVVDVTASTDFVVENPQVAFVIHDDDEVHLAGVVPAFTKMSATYAGRTDTVTIEVTEANLVLSELLPDNLKIPVGETGQLYFFGTYEDGVRLLLNDEATWSVTDDSVAQLSVDEGGKIFGLAPGAVNVTANYQTESQTVPVEVTDAEVVELQVYPPLVTAPVGEGVDLIAIAVYSDDSQRDATFDVTWSVLDDTIAVVSNGGESSGRVTGLVPGETEVVAKLGGAEDRSTITVTDAEVQNILVVPGLIVLHPGRTKQARAFAQYTNGVTHEVTEVAAWSMQNDNIAEVSNADGARGQITGISDGATAVEAEFGGVSGLRPVFVPENGFDQISIVPNDIFLAPGISTQLYAVGSYEEYPLFLENITAEAVWTSQNDGIASVDNVPFNPGRVTGEAPGQTSINANFKGLSTGKSVTVSQHTPVSLSVSPGDIVLPQNAIQPLTALVEYSNGEVFDLTADATFTSDNPAVVTLLDFFPGYLVALSPGEVTITVELGELTTETTVTVTDAIPVDVVLSPLYPTLPQYQSRIFYALALYDDGSQGDVSALCTWTSDNPESLLVLDEPYAKGYAYGLTVGSSYVEATCFGFVVGTTATVTSN